MIISIKHKSISLLLMGLCFATSDRAQNLPIGTNLKILRLTPPAHNFYTKVIYCYGIPIKAASVVNDEALIMAYQKMTIMLRYLPDVRQKLVHNGAQLHIIGKNQQTSDLPEFKDRKGKKENYNGILTTIDDRTRGMGGLYASCGEENLLSLPTDPYWGNAGIMIHEFAHDIMNNGMSKLMRQKIKTQYFNAVRKGLWADSYAGSNPAEYWAELSSWYFGSHGEFIRDSRIPAPGAYGLLQYDPEGYALCNNIYNEGKAQNLKPAIIPAKLVAKNTFSTNAFTNIAKQAGLTIINNTSQKILVNWIDFKGREQPFRTIEPMSRYTQLTFVNHIWMLTKLNKQPIGYYQVAAPDCEIAISYIK